MDDGQTAGDALSQRQRRNARRLGCGLGVFLVVVVATLFAWKLWF